MAAAPGAALAATPSTLQFAYTAGGAAPAAQSIQISNSGTGTLTWTAASSESWLNVSPASGTAPSTVSVSVSPASLAAGTYTATITITASGASNSPLSVTVTLTVAASAGYSVGVAAGTQLFLHVLGRWRASSSPNVSRCANRGLWHTVVERRVKRVLGQCSRAASGSASATLAVSVNAANLTAGSYTGAVQIAAAGSTASVSRNARGARYAAGGHYYAA